MRVGIWIRIEAWFRGGTVVWLRSFNGKIYLSIARETPWGDLVCPVYWTTNTGACILLNDGTVDPESESNYIAKWKKA